MKINGFKHLVPIGTEIAFLKTIDISVGDCGEQKFPRIRGGLRTDYKEYPS